MHVHLLWILGKALSLILIALSKITLQELSTCITVCCDVGYVNFLVLGNLNCLVISTKKLLLNRCCSVFLLTGFFHHIVGGCTVSSHTRGEPHYRVHLFELSLIYYYILQCSIKRICVILQIKNSRKLHIYYLAYGFLLSLIKCVQINSLLSTKSLYVEGLL